MTRAEKIANVARAHTRPFGVLVAALALMTWTSVAASVWFVGDVVTGLPDKDELRRVGTMAQATTLFDIENKPAFTIYKEQRIEVPLSRVSRELIQAVVAIEDQRFFEHGGVDVVRVAGAAFTNVREGRVAQGASTLTQQLARQSFLTADKTIRRKLKEIVVAARLESEYTKEQILELYLNKVYFGDGLYGVEAAALGFFGKHAADVNLGEAALLAGLVKSPSAYAPTVNLDRATARRDIVLAAMRDSGAIDPRTYAETVRQPVRLVDGLRREEGYGQYFKEEVRRQLIQRFGWERVYQGGLKVYTTIDHEVQKAAETEVARTIAEIEARQARSSRRTAPATAPLQAALVAMDPTTGEVRAMVGGRDFEQSHFNRATQARRQPGSAFKPFVYAAALERGYSPASLITNLSAPIMTYQGAWTPEDEHLASDSITMRAALRTSSNRAAVRMLEEIGIPTAVEYAKQLGVGSVPSVPSLALGSGEVTLLSMTAAYGTFANRGIVPIPSLIRRVETAGGEVLYTGGAPTTRAISEATAFIMSTMLADVVNSGTAWPARRVGFTLPAAGKTGTTNDYHDAWFVGYTPRLVTGVWVGYDTPRTIISNGYAGELAVPLWGRFMKIATDGDEPTWLRPPPTVTTATICRLSGMLATGSCHDTTVFDEEGNPTERSMVLTEYFVRGTEPTEYCNLHGRFETFAASVPDAPPAPASPAMPAAASPTPAARGATATTTPVPTAQQPPRRISQPASAASGEESSAGASETVRGSGVI